MLQIKQVLRRGIWGQELHFFLPKAGIDFTMILSENDL